MRETNDRQIFSHSDFYYRNFSSEKIPFHLPRVGSVSWLRRGRRILMNPIWLKMARATGLASTRFHSRFRHSTSIPSATDFLVFSGVPLLYF